VLTKALQSPAISATENGPSAEESSEEEGFLQVKSDQFFVSLPGGMHNIFLFYSVVTFYC
jgi:hypothetical protein